MRVEIQLIGSIQLYFSKTKMHFNLKDNATLADLYDEMGNSMGDSLSKAIWNHRKKRFRGPVVVVSNNVTLKEEDTLLHDNQLIELKRFLIGG